MFASIRNAFKNASSQIKVQPKRLHDFIPNPVETAKPCMAHESGTLRFSLEPFRQNDGS